MKQSSVDDARGVRQQLADGGPALAVPGEPESAGRDREALLPRGHAGQPLAHADRVGQLGPLEAGQQGLVVEQVHLRRRARLEQVDHPLRPGSEIGEALDAGAGRRRAMSVGRRRAVGAEQR